MRARAIADINGARDNEIFVVIIDKRRGPAWGTWKLNFSGDLEKARATADASDKGGFTPSRHLRYYGEIGFSSSPPNRLIVFLNFPDGWEVTVGIGRRAGVGATDARDDSFIFAGVRR